MVFGFSGLRAGRSEGMIVHKYLAEIIHLHRPKATAADAFSCKGRDPVLSMVVWILKREVRAFGECLGMYRR